jgi:hypothetical protein
MTVASHIQMFFDRTLHHRAKTSCAAVASCLCATVLVITTCRNEARAGLTPESPEVQALVARALHFMETHPDERLGAKCLQGLAFFKAGKAGHPRVSEAVAECLKVMRANPNEGELDVYSNGLAVIFLCEISPQKYAREIENFLGRLKARQKPHGGWPIGRRTGTASTSTALPPKILPIG